MNNNISRTWKLLNQMTCRNMTNKQITEIESNGTLLGNPQMIAEKFNHFFSNVGSDLANKIPKGNKKPEEFLKDDYPSSLFFIPVLGNEIHDIIVALKIVQRRVTIIYQCRF
jgi:hypothetical protein